MENNNCYIFWHPDGWNLGITIIMIVKQYSKAMYVSILPWDLIRGFGCIWWQDVTCQVRRLDHRMGKKVH